MTASFLRFAVVLIASMVALRAAEPAIIGKARAFIGSESALNNLKSIHYVGTLVSSDPADPKKQTRAALDIVFQKPDQQRISATDDKRLETTSLDGYDGWQRVTDATDRTKWRQTLLGSDQIKRLRANTWENLWFFRGIERIGGHLEEQGTKTIDGVACQKIAFVHAANIVFVRYFDVATGHLVLTETEGGGTIVEEGEMVVNGVRFPRSIVTTTKTANGGTQVVTISFDKITTNETFPSSFFAVPSLSER